MIDDAATLAADWAARKAAPRACRICPSPARKSYSTCSDECSRALSLRTKRANSARRARRAAAQSSDLYVAAIKHLNRGGTLPDDLRTIITREQRIPAHLVERVAALVTD